MNWNNSLVARFRVIAVATSLRSLPAAAANFTATVFADLAAGKGKA